MPQIAHEFTVVRKDTECELRASFEVTVGVQRRAHRSKRNSDIETSNGGRAELTGEIFLADGGIPWIGHLNKREQEQIEKEVYEMYMESNESSRPNRLTDDSCLLDGEFDDDVFDEDMALRVTGRGSVSW
jgi:hypothetical protein